MLRILGNANRLCDGLTRRDLLHVGGAGVLGLTLNGLLEAASRQASSPLSKAGNLRIARQQLRPREALLFLFSCTDRRASLKRST